MIIFSGRREFKETFVDLSKVLKCYTVYSRWWQTTRGCLWSTSGPQCEKHCSRVYTGQRSPVELSSDLLPRPLLVILLLFHHLAWHPRFGVPLGIEQTQTHTYKHINGLLTIPYVFLLDIVHFLRKSFLFRSTNDKHGTTHTLRKGCCGWWFTNHLINVYLTNRKCSMNVKPHRVLRLY